jgi:hypothetical protein
LDRGLNGLQSWSGRDDCWRSSSFPITAQHCNHIFTCVALHSQFCFSN